MLKLPPITYIDSTHGLKTLVKNLSNEAQLAVDTESNSMYAYYGRVCLVQLSTREQDYIIDPLAIDDMQPLGDLLYDESIEKIFHAADYDLICLKRDYDFEVRNLFDTMFAARLAGVKVFGLADLLNEHFGVEVDKRHQLDNWGKRPLEKDSLVYAQMDTHYLHQLRDNLYDELAQLGHLEEAQEIFEDVLHIEVKEREFDRDGYWKIGRPKSLSRRQMSILRELYLLREKLAEKEDRPPFKVMSNQALVNMAMKQPQGFNSLHHIKGLGKRAVHRYGTKVLKAIDRGLSNKVPKPPKREMPDPILAERYTAFHAWRKNCAIERNLDSSLILSKHTLWELAREMPTNKDELAEIDGIGSWRLRNYGDGLLDVISELR